MERLGLNQNGYAGEHLDIDTVLGDIEGAARQHGWTVEKLAVAGGLELTALTRPPAAGTRPSTRRLYLSTGIHGDEPAGPLAVRQLLQENDWPPEAGLWICPCLNPSGFNLRRRENARGQDLNRQYLHLQAEETRVHVEWLARQPSFDAAICLHEDWESQGFYLYELNPENRPSHAPDIIRRVAPICPVDLSPVIEGRPAQGGIVRPSSDPASRPDWPEAFWLLTHKTRHSYTLEAPSDFPLVTRVAALVTAAKTICGG